MASKGVSASQTGPSQVEPVPVSPLRASVPDAVRLSRKYGHLLDRHFAYRRTVLTWPLCARIERILPLVRDRIDAARDERLAA